MAPVWYNTGHLLYLYTYDLLHLHEILKELYLYIVLCVCVCLSVCEQIVDQAAKPILFWRDLY